ncbi:hypothetical protein Poli38472_005894 [Pythium oligandrum]|uniref:Phosphomethylpyrimidine kinase n=1 Tax=Pythium oligandrum TaxID=41045 RepID=A0A8K1CTQ1_PYTOL|nr:hypothetical protein Poli38472_005894 [Pythium oligandrum]|eukprot:TMW68426.1 hypothetical protein Poli38472_005894 [Pythium oligandrum]
MTTMLLPDSMARALWTQAELKAFQCLYHPFVVRLANGTLAKDEFQAFLLQDAYYLHGFAKAFAYAVTKCASPEHSLAIIRLMGGIEEELRTHSAFLQSFGIELFQVQETTVAPATRHYVDFLLSTAKNSSSVVEILTAMTPCMRLYSFIGKAIDAAAIKTLEGVENPYQRWINAYCTDEFEKAAEVTETLLDELAAFENVSYETLVPLYNRAMELELRFFEEYSPLARASPLSLHSYPLEIHVDLDDASWKDQEITPVLRVKAAMEWTLSSHERDLDALWNLPPGAYHVFIDRQDEAHLVSITSLSSPRSSTEYSPLLSVFAASQSVVNPVHTQKRAELVTFLKSLAASASFTWYSTPSSIAHAAHRVPRVLTIAGSDSGGGAGIQADIKTCTTLGVFSTTALTAVTVQNTHGVHGIHAIPLNDLADQITCVLDDIGTDVVKTGMLFNEEIIEKVATLLETRQLPLVVDPVMVATSGHRLLKAAAHESMVERLFPLATIITPNIPEASALLEDRVIDSVDAMHGAAQALAAFGSRFVLVKGGHLSDPPGNCVHDVLYDAERDEFHVIKNKKLKTRNTHGTGCTLAAAIAAYYAKSPDMVRAVKAAIAYLHGLLESSQSLTLGGGASGPMLHTAA